MSHSLRAFNIGLYVEHIEEAAFLYEQINTLRASSEIPWARLDDFEQRLEAHLDALVLGGTLALQVCQQRLAEQEAGEWFVVVCVICRQQHAALLKQAWSTLDFDNAAQVAAVTAALAAELPSTWQLACERAVASGNPRLLPIVAMAGAMRQLPLTDTVVARLNAEPALIDARMTWALSRLPSSPGSLHLLHACTSHADDEVKRAAMLALLRHGARVALQPLYPLLQIHHWPQRIMGIAGDRDALPHLRERLISRRATPDTLYALALLGELSSVRAICDCLADEILAEAASWALFWITGASLGEEAFIAEQVDESELFPRELAAWKERGEAPLRDGQPYGARVKRVSRDAEAWRRWLHDHAAQFDPRLRYRLGQPHSPRMACASLRYAHAPHALRCWVTDELRVRFNCPIRFEADWRVRDQQRALTQIEAWVAEQETADDRGV